MRTTNRTLRALAVAVAGVAVLSGCGSAKEPVSPAASETTVPSAVLDPALTKLLPIGAHEMDLRMTAPNGSELQVSGYLDLGEAADGAQCRTDLKVRQDIKGDNASLTEITIRRDGDVTWHRLDKTTTELPDDVSLEWVDSVDFNAVRPALIFAPLFVTDGMPIVAGGGSGICTLRLLDQTAALDPGTGKVVYDLKRVQRYMSAAFTLFTEQFLRAGGAEDAEIDEFVPQLVERGTPDFAQMLGALQLNLERDDDKIVLTQTFNVEGFSLTATFTPVSSQVIDKVDGTSFYDRLEQDPLHTKTVGQLLEEGVDAWLNRKDS